MADILKQRVGIFKGFSESGLEFKAEIVTPYHTEFHPVLGSFLIVETSAESYLLGRITKFYPVGVMSGDEADEYLARLIRTDRPVPEDIKEAKLRYNVNVKLLGGMVVTSRGKPQYRPSIRILPHLGAFVGVPGEEIVQYLCSIGANEKEKPVDIGNFALGDVVFDGSGGRAEYKIGFDIRNLISRRTYVFAHAGYGKTNLIKFLVSKLYAEKAEAGMLIFDPEGEYAFADRKGRPGLAEIPEIRSKIAVYTDRRIPKKYERFDSGRLGFNLSEFTPASIIANCVLPEKLENVWANVVRGLSDQEWDNLVDELDRNGYRADSDTIRNIVHSRDTSVPQSILNNLVPVVRRLHRPNSRMMESIVWHLQHGNIVIVDISLMSSIHGRWLASLILGHIFEQNQRSFVGTGGEELTSVVAVIEEAQAVLSTRPGGAENIFVTWAKEGRKYNLGAVFVTQQPGAISQELLSQGDNFFVFHLLSSQDLFTLRNANAHFSDDILASLLNEPIPGNAYFWSAPYQPFVLPMHVTNFETYATERATHEIPLENTAGERFALQIPTLQDELDRTVRKNIESEGRVPVYANLTVDGASSQSDVAVKLWNLKFSIADSLSKEGTRLYCDTMQDGKSAIRDQIIYQSLKRQNIDHRTCFYQSSRYVLLQKKGLAISKTVKMDPLSLSSSDVQIDNQPRDRSQPGLENFAP